MFFSKKILKFKLLVFVFFNLFILKTQAQTIVTWDSAYTESVHNICQTVRSKIKINITPGANDTLINSRILVKSFQKYQNFNVIGFNSTQNLPLNFINSNDSIYFVFDSIFNSETITIEYEALPKCPITAGGPFNDTFVFDDGNNSNIQISNIYNVYSPVISILSNNNTPNSISEGDYFTRFVHIINGGFGALSKLYFKDLISGGNLNIDINSFKIFNNSDTFNVPSTQISIIDSVTFTIDSFAFKSINDLNPTFDLNEELFVCYRMQLSKCSNSSSIDINTHVNWGCDSILCNKLTSNSSVNVVQTTDLNLIFNNFINQDIFCFNEVFADSFLIINTTEVKATNVNISLVTNGNYRFLIRDSVYVQTPNDTLRKLNVPSLVNSLSCHPNGSSNISFVIDSLGAFDTIKVIFYQVLCDENNCLPYHTYAFNSGTVTVNMSYTDDCKGITYNDNISIGNNYNRSIFSQMFSSGLVYNNDSARLEIKTEFLTLSPANNHSFFDIEVIKPRGLSDSMLFYKAYYITRGDSIRMMLQKKDSNIFRVSAGELLGQKSIYFNLKADCQTARSGLDTVRINFYSYHDTACQRSNLMCFEVPIFISCPQNCDTGGMQFYYFNAKRQNLSQKDQNNDGTSDSLSNEYHELVRFKTITTGDSLCFTYKGVVDSGQINQGFKHVLSSLSAPNLSTLFGIASAKFTLKRIGLDTTINVLPYFTSIDSIAFEFSGIDSFYHADSIEFQLILINLEKTGTRLPIDHLFSAHLYTKQLDNSIPEMMFECQKQADMIKHYQAAHLFSYVPLIPIINCNRSQFCLNYNFKTNSSNPFNITNEFEYEHRFIALPDTFRWIFPTEYNIQSVNLNITKRIQAVGTTTTLSFNSIPFQISADTLIILNDTIKKQIALVDESYSFSYCVDLFTSSCDLIDSLSPSIQTNQKIVGSESPKIDTLFRQFNSPVLTTLNPNINFNGTIFTQNVVNNKTVWDVFVNNADPAIIPNFWIYPINNSGQTLIDSIYSGTQKINPSDSGFYQLGDMSPLSTLNLKFYLNIRSCSEDKIFFMTGYNCYSYPSSIQTLGKCTLSRLTLTTIPQVSEIQAAVTQLNVSPIRLYQLNSANYGGSTIDMCDTFPIEIVINSSQNGSIYDVDLEINLPNVSGQPGFDLIRDSLYIIYPANSTPRKASNVGRLIYNNATNTIQFRLYELDSLNFNTQSPLPGIASTNFNNFTIRFLAQANCDFVSGSYFSITTRANNLCNNPAIGNNNISASPQYDITGITNSYSTNIRLTDSIINGCKTDALSFFIHKIGSDTVRYQDSIYVTLSNSIQIDSIKNRNSNLSINYSILNQGSQYLISFLMPQNLGNNDTAWFDIYAHDQNNFACNNALNFEVLTTQRVQAYCALTASFCSNLRVSTGSYAGQFSIQKPRYYFAAFNAWVNRYLPPYSYGYNAIIANGNPENTQTNDSFVVEVYFDKNNNLIFDNSDTSIQTYNYSNFNYTNPVFINDSFVGNSPIPNSQLNMYGIIRRSQNSASFCNCDTFIISPMALSLPFNENRFEVNHKKCQQELLVFGTKEIKSVIFQKSIDGFSFEDLAHIKQSNGTFKYLSNNMTTTVLYYRAIYIDELGNKTTSPTIEAQNYCTTLEMEILPNPNSGQFVIQIKQNLPKTPSKIRIYDSKGQLIKEFEMLLQNKNNEIPIKIEEKGIYLIEVSNLYHRKTAKVIVME